MKEPTNYYYKLKKSDREFLGKIPDRSNLIEVKDSFNIILNRN